MKRPYVFISSPRERLPPTQPSCDACGGPCRECEDWWKAKWKRDTDMMLEDLAELVDKLDRRKAKLNDALCELKAAKYRKRVYRVELKELKAATESDAYGHECNCSECSQ